jgi:hypothetical protein
MIRERRRDILFGWTDLGITAYLNAWAGFSRPGLDRK